MDESSPKTLSEKAKILFIQNPLNYYTLRLAFILFLCIVGAIHIYFFEEESISFLDSLFISTSCATGTGLQTVSSLDLSSQTFAVLGTCMFLGNIFLLLIPPMVARQYYNRKVLGEYKDRLNDIDPLLIEEHNLLNQALKASIGIFTAYLLLWHILISTVIYGALLLHPNEPELEQRGYSRYQNSLFLTVAGFSNSGITISSGGLSYWSNNPLAYFTLSLAILAGNTCIPIFLYFTFWWLIKIYNYFRWNAASLRFVLQNPSQISSHVLPWDATQILLYGVIIINTVQYICFLASTAYEQVALDTYGSMEKLAGMGYFQTISTRSAGITVSMIPQLM